MLVLEDQTTYPIYAFTAIAFAALRFGGLRALLNITEGTLVRIEIEMLDLSGLSPESADIHMLSRI